MANSQRNQTLKLLDEEIPILKQNLISLTSKNSFEQIKDKTINQDLFEVLDFLPDKFVDLLFIDPPYNIRKEFNDLAFSEMGLNEYMEWMDGWLKKMPRLLKDNASIYICGDWRSSAAIEIVGSRYFKVRNRITWEREKGRGSKVNWKNNSEDIWFFTNSNKYLFNFEDVKLKKKVIAPYTNDDGQPKDWEQETEGGFRLTFPSNLWTDISIPFWSMPENTEHPTQKPEKLLAKIILASSNINGVIFDPFLGSGTTSVVAKKLNRSFVGVEQDLTYALYAEKRLKTAEVDKFIQGYMDGVFWERNTGKIHKRPV